MKKFLILFFAGLLSAMLVGCAHEKYGEYTVQAVNTNTGISAGMTENGELLVLARNEDRQAIYIPTNRVGQVHLFNSTEAPLLYVKVNFFGKKGCSILRIDLPSKDMELKFYRHREIAKSLTWRGKKAWIIDLKEVSPDGKTLRVVFDSENDTKRRTGDFNPESNTITVR